MHAPRNTTVPLLQYYHYNVIIMTITAFHWAKSEIPQGMKLLQRSTRPLKGLQCTLGCNGIILSMYTSILLKLYDMLTEAIIILMVEPSYAGVMECI